MEELTKTHHVILHYTILYDSILFYTVLYSNMLCYAVLYYTILYYTILYYTILYYTIRYYTTPDFLALCVSMASWPPMRTQREARCTRSECLTFPHFLGFGCRVSGVSLGLRVQGLGFRV